MATYLGSGNAGIWTHFALTPESELLTKAYAFLLATIK